MIWRLIWTLEFKYSQWMARLATPRPTRALQDAVSRRDAEAAARCLERGADPMHAGPHCRPPLLHQAVEQGSVAIVHLMLDRGADVNAAGYVNPSLGFRLRE